VIVHEISLQTADLHLLLTVASDGPVLLAAAGVPGAPSIVSPLPFVDVYTATERKTRMSRSYAASSVGKRLRYVSHELSPGSLRLVQHDPATGLHVTSVFKAALGVSALRLHHVVENRGTGRIDLVAVPTAVLGLGEIGPAVGALDVTWGESEWIAEGRWQQRALSALAPSVDLAPTQPEGRAHFALTSHGSWSTGEVLPTGVVSDRESGAAIAWQVETSAAWHAEYGQVGSRAYLSLVGPADVEHHFVQPLDVGDSWQTVPVGLAFSADGRDGAFAALTGYRRWSRSTGPADALLPVVYNDYMNTLMGDPTTEKLTPLIDAAAAAGAEYFCIDAGWHTELGDTAAWSAIGDWVEVPGRFSDGLLGVVGQIRDRGMVPGLWLEPESVGVRARVAETLPDEAFFMRFGERVRDQDRFQLDFRHPAARAHLDDRIDALVADYAIGYFKLDYNVNPGPGTDSATAGAGAGLLDHTRAYRDWLVAVQARHPHVLFENCAAGAMRMDYSLLAISHLQSTSDQPDYLRYAPIAAAAPASILPEQCANWVYPAAGLDAEQTAFTLVNGLAGRLYLTGFLGDLSATQAALVADAVRLSKKWRHWMAASTPSWPLGLPGWHDDVLAIRLTVGGESLFAVWNRGADAATVRLPEGETTAELLFPGFAEAPQGDLELPPGPAARLYLLR